MTFERVLDLHGAHPVAGDLEHFARPPRMEEEAVGIAPGQVPGPEPPVAEDGGRFLRLVEVTQRHAVSARDQVAGLPRCQLHTFVVHHLELYSRDRDPDGGLLVRRLLGGKVAET